MNIRFTAAAADLDIVSFTASYLIEQMAPRLRAAGITGREAAVGGVEAEVIGHLAALIGREAELLGGRVVAEEGFEPPTNGL